MAFFLYSLFAQKRVITKARLPNVRIYAYAYKKRISVNTDMRISASVSKRLEINGL